MAKGIGTVYVCQNCGHQSRKWLGKCPDCGEWNSFVERSARAAATASKGDGGARRLPSARGEARPLTARSSRRTTRASRRASTEFDRVLGGGIVPGSLILIGGDPGIGKSHAAAASRGQAERAGRARALRLGRGVRAADQDARRAAGRRGGEPLPAAGDESRKHPRRDRAQRAGRDHRRFDPDGLLVEDRVARPARSRRCARSRGSS